VVRRRVVFERYATLLEDLLGGSSLSFYLATEHVISQNGILGINAVNVLETATAWARGTLRVLYPHSLAAQATCADLTLLGAALTAFYVWTLRLICLPADNALYDHSLQWIHLCNNITPSLEDCF
jgi:hypothetical protein